MDKKKYIEFLKWFCESDFITSEIGGYWQNYKNDEIKYTAEQVVDFFINKQNKGDTKKKYTGQLNQLPANKNE